MRPQPNTQSEHDALRHMLHEAKAYVQDHGWAYRDLQAEGLVRDAVDHFMSDTWFQVNATRPYDLISQKFLNYLKALPKKDRDTREWEAYRGERFRFNLKTKCYENSRERLADPGPEGPRREHQVLKAA